MGMTKTSPFTPTQHVSLVTLLCPEYAPALSFYAGLLNFTIQEDSTHDDDPSRRFIVLTPPKLCQLAPQMGLLVQKAVTKRDRRAVGNQAGDAVFMFLEVDNFDEAFGKMKGMGIEFEDEEPRQEKFGKAALFRDPFGNRINLVDRPCKRIGSLYAQDWTAVR
ncbi:Glyoxalase/Bleomycin resistance protein/Dihydroxybiphenyl dioxygenase [Morchella snyderi]|nr:Glyoxalase/Bleomycin resistance protein/Dihydroxybiphenyl dioxygenase [Morchella snyderi]